MAQLMPLPLTVSCFSKIQIGFTFLVPAHLGIPGKRAVKRLTVENVIKLIFDARLVIFTIIYVIYYYLLFLLVQSSSLIGKSTRILIDGVIALNNTP